MISPKTIHNALNGKWQRGSLKDNGVINDQRMKIFHLKICPEDRAESESFLRGYFIQKMNDLSAALSSSCFGQSFRV